MDKKSKKTVGIAVVFVMIFMGIIIVLNKASVQRALKSINSEYSGGLDRTVTVYDYDGNEITQYTGKIDIEDTETGGKVKFDLDGKRTIIYGGIVIVQEN
ncbi:hypothetical protein SAMN04487770_11735 [Butyrivibrio sp. ob235]|uniref:hypothetical protein n=1 Tax=Butyrivibrio sp. ob235 TaxID=1761780 RepID=UPI0008C85911|nr:hypothetical protein [Butyrivibrio sp. ob235]SEL77309.1 hypothetical protein SAMN04487770_11735 [Butyrivibrio sp. ob235]